MKVIVENRLVVGTLKTLVGTYSLLDNTVRLWNGTSRFNIVDDEGFDTWARINGDYVLIDAAMPTEMNVKRVLTEGEAEELKDILQAQTDEVLQS